MNQLRTLFTERKSLLLASVFLFSLPLIPQLLYWKATFGDWIVYSYDQEKFFFLKSHVMDGYFGFRKGFFLYTPVMIFAFIGLFIMRNRKQLILPLVYILPLFSFVVFSWWCWWYGGYSSRVLIETYPFLLLGMAQVAEYISETTRWKRILITPLFAFCIWQNIRFTELYERGIIHWDSMTADTYQAVFWNNQLPDNYFELLKKPDYDKASKEGE